MTRRSSSDQPPQLKSLRLVLDNKQAELAKKREERDEARQALRSLERSVASLDVQVRALTEIVLELQPEEAEKVTQLHARHAGDQAEPAKMSLHGMPRVHAIEMILGEAGDQALHRTDVWTAMKQRGFPHESIADTSAGLAYLKRLGRVVNPARGYWRLGPVTSLTG